MNGMPFFSNIRRFFASIKMSMIQALAPIIVIGIYDGYWKMRGLNYSQENSGKKIGGVNR